MYSHFIATYILVRHHTRCWVCLFEVGTLYLHSTFKV
uniref:Uncharacterized protein n=1 Tax=Arundo donax TaxID=35708 RepID=A0A0A9AUX3_ARUDO